MRLPYDLSGSMSKNRFRYELLWGLNKMISLFGEGVEFTVVFDYVCDVEVHLDTHFEFYQLKTQNNNGSYTINKLTNIKKNETKSVLGNLYILKYDENFVENNDTHIYIVSNAPLKDSEKVYTDKEVIKLNEISEESKKKLKQCIKNELNIDKEISLNKSYFIRTSMNLIKPKSEIIGQLVMLFEEKLRCNCKNITSLYRILESEVFSRGCYELKLDNYDDIVKNKGFTSKQLEEILNEFIDISNIAVEKTKEYIESNYTLRNKFKLKMALSKVLIGLKSNKTLQGIEKEIVEYINENIDNMDKSENEIIKIIKEEVYHKKTIEISDDEIEVLVLLTLKKYEEGVYE